MPMLPKFAVGATTAAMWGALCIAMMPSGPAAAADDCAAKPGAPPPQGFHWYYQTDRVNNRRCWRLLRVSETGAPILPPTARSSQASARMPQEAPTAFMTAVKPSTDARAIPDSKPARAASSLSEAQRDVLFQEFLEWERMRRNTRTN